MSVQPFSITEREGARDGQQVFVVTGPLTSSTTQTFVRAVRPSQAKVVILDLTGVPYLDSMGVGALVHACVSCRRSGRHLALAGLNSRVSTVLKITGVEPVFDIFPSSSAAEAAL